MSGGYCDRIAWVDLTSQKIQIESLARDFKERYVGGRGFIARWLMNLVPADVDPLAASNVLAFATGPLTGTIAPTSSRMAVGALAPETGIFSIGSVGGSFGTKLKRAGVDAVVIMGRSPEPVYLLISNDGIQIRDANHLWGLDVYQTEAAIRRENKDSRLSVASIGQAGESGVFVSTIMVDHVRAAGRGGLGAVMGSKNLKAVAVYGSGSVPIHDPHEFWLACEKLQKDAVKKFFASRWKSGTYGALTRYNSAGALTTYNAQKTAFEHIDLISAEYYNSHFKIGMRACIGCAMPCWSIYTIQSGEFAGLYSDSVNASTFKELGARCGMTEMDAILQAHDDLNRYGLDTISTPATISFAMECYQRGIISKEDTGGLDLKWGNKHAIIPLIKQIARNTGFGAQLAWGVRRCAQNWGEEAQRYALHVKGLETVATDPRGQPSWGLGYATSSRGACHMRAYGNFEYGGMDDKSMIRISGTTEIADRFGTVGKGNAVAFLEDMHAFGDSLGTCKFMTRAELGFPEALMDVVNTATGASYTADSLYNAGERISNVERIANLQRGMTPADDTLPDRYLNEAVPEGPAEGKVCDLEPMLKEYYKHRDWNWEDGYPSNIKLQQLGLDRDGKDV
jgi:aldehyde:ferredoxin oxidoreductase